MCFVPGSQSLALFVGEVEEGDLVVTESQAPAEETFEGILDFVAREDSRVCTLVQLDVVSRAESSVPLSGLKRICRWRVAVAFAVWAWSKWLRHDGACGCKAGDWGAWEEGGYGRKETGRHVDWVDVGSGGAKTVTRGSWGLPILSGSS